MNASQSTLKRNVLSLAVILEGTGLFDLETSETTPFTVTIPTDAMFNAQVGWLQTMLPHWDQLLRQQTVARPWTCHEWGEGLQVKDEGPKARFDRAKIVAHLFVPGRIKLEKIKHERTRMKLAGQIKKILAQEVAEKFPPPFTIKDPMLSSNCECAFYIKTDRIHGEWDIRELDRAHEHSFHYQLESFFKNECAKMMTFAPPVEKNDVFRIGCAFNSNTSLADFRNFERRLQLLFLHALSARISLRDETELN